MKSFLEKRFKHGTWFKEGVSVGFAIDYFAKTPEFYLKRKPKLKQSGNLLDDIMYDDIITDGKCFYRLSLEEKDYYIKRKEYWEEQKRLEEEKWLNTRIDKEKELSNYLCCNSNYDIEYVERELSYTEKDDDKKRICFWKNELKIRKRKRNIIDDFISKFFNSVITNKDFIEFKNAINVELNKI